MGEYDQLRRQAEEKIPARINITEAITPEEAQRIIHELQVHQIELELQNEDMRKTQRQMEESRARYADLYDFAPVGYLTLDRYGIIQEANLTAATQLGVERGRLINSPLHVYMDSQDRERWRSHCNQVFAEPGRQTFEVRLRSKDGGQFDAWLESIAGKDILGHQLLRTAITDITARKQAEEELKNHRDDLERRTAELVEANEQLKLEIEKRHQIEDALRESEQRYKKLIESVTTYIYRVMLQNGKAVAITHGPGCEAVTGYTAEEYSATPDLWYRMVYEADKEYVLAQIDKAVVGEVILPLEHRITHKNGQVIWVRNTIVPIYNQERQLVVYDGLIEEITDRKLAEEALRRNRIHLQMVFDGIPDPLLMVDQHMRLKLMNQAAEKYYVVSTPQDFQDNYCYECLTGSSVPCAGCDIPAAVLTGKSTIFERKGFKDPDRIEKVNIYYLGPEVGSEGNAVIRITDITEARLMERQMVQSEKLASIGVLVAGVAHEINNPNNFITLNIPILRAYLHQIIPFMDDYAEAHNDFAVLGMSYRDFREDIFELVDNLEYGSSRINATVSALSEFARERGTKEKSWVDLKLVLEKAISLCRGRLMKSVRNFSVNIPDELPPVLTNPLSLEQVLVNLLINAAQAADKYNSWIELNVSREELEPEQLIIAVSDNGCGMDAVTQQRIFDPFFTTKGPGVGTGLGLSISHRLMEELGGRLEVSSEVGLGSTFKVILYRENKLVPVIKET